MLSRCATEDSCILKCLGDVELALLLSAQLLTYQPLFSVCIARAPVALLTLARSSLCSLPLCCSPSHGHLAQSAPRAVWPLCSLPSCSLPLRCSPSRWLPLHGLPSRCSPSHCSPLRSQPLCCSPSCCSPSCYRPHAVCLCAPAPAPRSSCPCSLHLLLPSLATPFTCYSLLGFGTALRHFQAPCVRAIPHLGFASQCLA